MRIRQKDEVENEAYRAENRDNTEMRECEQMRTRRRVTNLYHVNLKKTNSRLIFESLSYTVPAVFWHEQFGLSDCLCAGVFPCQSFRS